jgi:hypothetical protein
MSPTSLAEHLGISDGLLVHCQQQTPYTYLLGIIGRRFDKPVCIERDSVPCVLEIL